MSASYSLSLFFFILLSFFGHGQTIRNDAVYMDQDYLNTIAEKQSVAGITYEEPFLFGFRLYQNGIDCTLHGFTKHEGGIEIAFLYNPIRKQFTSIDPIYSYVIDVIDSTLLSVTDTKTGSIKPYSAHSSIEDALRDQLISGTYTDRKGNQVEFSKDGTVTHFFNGDRYFEIGYDFGLGIDFDIINTFTTSKGGNWGDGHMYHFVVDKDTLLLYPVQSDWGQLEHRIAKTPIVLTRRSD